MTLKGQYIENIELEIINWPRKSNLQIKFFRNLEKNYLCAYVENTLNSEKVMKISISRLIMNNIRKVLDLLFLP